MQEFRLHCTPVICVLCSSLYGVCLRCLQALGAYENKKYMLFLESAQEAHEELRRIKAGKPDRSGRPFDERGAKV